MTGPTFLSGLKNIKINMRGMDIAIKLNDALNLTASKETCIFYSCT